MKKSIITFAKITVSISLLYFLGHTSQLNFNLLPELLHSPALLFCSILLCVLVICISTWRWQKLNQAQGIPLGYRQTLLPTYLGIAFNNLLPGGIGGDFFRFYFLNKRTKIPSKSAVMLSIFIDRVTGLAGIFMTVCLITVLNVHHLLHIEIIKFFLAASLFFCTTGGVLYVISKLVPQKIRVKKWFVSLFENNKSLSRLRPLLDAIVIYRNSKITLLQCLLTSILIQLLIAATCLLIARMMHFSSISFQDYVIAIAVTQIVNLIPIAPGGFGVGELAFANIILLLNPGVTGTFATIFLAYRILGYLIYCPGLIVFVLERDSLNKNTFLQTQTTT